jgi:hypothetical protein
MVMSKEWCSKREATTSQSSDRQTHQTEEKTQELTAEGRNRIWY